MDHELQSSLMELSFFVHLSLMEAGNEVVGFFEVKYFATNHQQQQQIYNIYIYVTHFLVFLQSMNGLLSANLKFLLPFLLILSYKLFLLQGEQTSDHTQCANNKLTI